MYTSTPTTGGFGLSVSYVIILKRKFQLETYPGSYKMPPMKKLLSIVLVCTALEAYAVPEPIGFYSDGHLLNSEQMPETGPGFIQMYRDTNRYYATREIIQMLINTSAFMDKKFPKKDRLQIEEMSAPEGGDIDRHGSHENGLDVDLQYYKLNAKEHDPVATGQRFADPMVIKGKVSPNFDKQRNWEMVKALHKFGKVQRIFMDQILKNSLCSYARSVNEYALNINVLRSIRHVANHQDHLHVRLRCPMTAKRCVPQEETPVGSGCPKK